MANREKGEVSFEASGSTFTMKLGTGAMCEIEDASKKSIAEIGKILGNPETATLSLVRLVFWASLQHHHAGTTIEHCNDLIDDIGVSQVGVLIGKAFQAASPKRDIASGPRKATAA